jgi:hypothetical protein
MLRLMKENQDALGIPATDVQFDSTIARTLVNLQQRSVELNDHNHRAMPTPPSSMCAC